MRHLATRFVDSALVNQAYEDTSLPIGLAQTISKPSVVARVIELLLAGRTDANGRLGRVLEVGTGCGYQAALLSRLARHVYSVERIGELLTRARRNLHELKITNVRLKHADGHIGLKESAPFDAIILAAAATHVPDALQEQLAVG